MPPTKKEVKPEEPLFVDEEGSYVHEAEQAKYKGGVRRFPQGGTAEGSGGAAQNARSNSPSSKGGASGAPQPTSLGGGGRGGGAGRVGSASSPHTQAAAAGINNNIGGPSESALMYRHGRGTYTCPSFTYEGDWEEDEMHGHGQLTFTVSGNTYTGAFSHGCFAGQGTYKWSDGAVYCGQWRANRMHGDGVYTDAQGHIWTGKYYNGTGPGLVRLYPTLERVDGAALTEGAAPTTVNAVASPLRNDV